MLVSSCVRWREGYKGEREREGEERFCIAPPVSAQVMGSGVASWRQRRVFDVRPLCASSCGRPWHSGAAYRRPWPRPLCKPCKRTASLLPWLYSKELSSGTPPNARHLVQKPVALWPCRSMWSHCGAELPAPFMICAARYFELCWLERASVMIL
jgi:hypothetical protein